MPFPKKDVERLLVDTGHRCCLCNARGHLTLHHIVPAADGGAEDIDNAIPLCPNCHHVVHDSREFAASELKALRDRTLALVARQVDLVAPRRQPDYDIFLSYCHADRAAVSAVAEALASAGLRVFDAAEQKTSIWGESFDTWLKQKMPELARVAIVFLSRNYVESRWCERELSCLAAQGRDRLDGPFILPIRLDDVASPSSLADVSWLDLATSTPEEIALAARGRLAKAAGEWPRSLSSQSDEALLRLVVARRSIDAFKVLHSRLCPLALRFIRSQGVDEAFAYLIAQGVMQQLWEHIDSVLTGEQLYEFLRHLSALAVLSHIRVSSDVSGQQEKPSKEVSEESARAIIEELPEEVRGVVEMRLTTDLPMSLIANKLDISEPEAAERYQTAVDLLRQKFSVPAPLEEQ